MPVEMKHFCTNIKISTMSHRKRRPRVAKHRADKAYVTFETALIVGINAVANRDVGYIHKS
jgi:hypothetical protein